MNTQMRIFGTRGPVSPDFNYVVYRKEEIAVLTDWMKRGRYVVITAPRQTGKTTFFRWALERLTEEDPTYLPIQLDFEIYIDATVEEFYADLQRQICREISRDIQQDQSTIGQNLRGFFANDSITDHLSFAEFMHQLSSMLAGRRVMMIIDEFDGIPQKALRGFLHVLRRIYISGDQGRCPHSLGIVGVKSVPQLDAARSISPFNIQEDFTLPNFTLEGVKALFAQYRDEVGRVFSPEVIDEIYFHTGGQPFLVNRFAQILTEEMEIPIDETIHSEHFEVAYRQLLDEPNIHLLNLTANIRRSPGFEGLLMNICLDKAGIPFNLRNNVISDLANYGILKRGVGGFCEISNPIYQYNIMQTFQALDTDAEDTYVPNLEFAEEFAAGFAD